MSSIGQKRYFLAPIFTTSFIWQVACVALLSFIPAKENLEGILLRSWLISLAVYWTTALYLIARRRHALDVRDIFILTHGYPIFLSACAVFMSLFFDFTLLQNR